MRATQVGDSPAASAFEANVCRVWYMARRQNQQCQRLFIKRGKQVYCARRCSRGKEDTCTARQVHALARSSVEPQIDAVVQEAAGTPAGRDPLSAATRTARDNGVNY